MSDGKISNEYLYNPTVYHCALCGEDILIRYPTGTTKLKFCSPDHKYEYYNNMKLTDAQVSVLELLEDTGLRVIPKSNTVYTMSSQNEKRVMPLIEHVIQLANGNNMYRITEYGKLVLDNYRERVYNSN